MASRQRGYPQVGVLLQVQVALTSTILFQISTISDNLDSGRQAVLGEAKIIEAAVARIASGISRHTLKRAQPCVCNSLCSAILVFDVGFAFTQLQDDSDADFLFLLPLGILHSHVDPQGDSYPLLLLFLFFFITTFVHTFFVTFIVFHNCQRSTWQRDFRSFVNIHNTNLTSFVVTRMKANGLDYTILAENTHIASFPRHVHHLEMLFDFCHATGNADAIANKQFRLFFFIFVLLFSFAILRHVEE
mmetsp:Transcript_3213/g.3716  ORF Transcript_3213/g.3716 Transcript_3213/m.3716 type:complete len:246 (-) Transcript_3213:66-803(-)